MNKFEPENIEFSVAILTGGQNLLVEIAVQVIATKLHTKSIFVVIPVFAKSCRSRAKAMLEFKSQSY